MKPLLAPLSDTIAEAIKITRRDGEIYAFTSHDVSDTVAGQLYDCNPGFTGSTITTKAGFQVNTLELRTLDDGTVFTEFDFHAGKWNDAQFIIFRYDYVTLQITEYKLAGTLGELTRDEGSGEIVVELRCVLQKLQQDSGSYSTPTCRARLGDARCQKDLTNLTFDFTVTAVTDQRNFEVSMGSPSFGDDYFGFGEITWLNGNNAELTFLVENSWDDGRVEIALPAIGEIQVGDSVRMVAGCRGRFELDCYTKFDNYLNFQGEPHRPNVDDITRYTPV